MMQFLFKFFDKTLKYVLKIFHKKILNLFKEMISFFKPIF